MLRVPLCAPLPFPVRLPACLQDGARIDQVSTRSPAKLMAMLALWLNPEP